MSNCEKYFDMISAYADGELTDSEKAELEAHLEVCMECRSLLEAYRSISEEIALDTQEVPEDFSSGVMEKINGFENNAARKIRRRSWTIAGRWIGAAACIAVILFAFPQMPGLGCGSKAMDDAAADFEMNTDTTAGTTQDSFFDYSSDYSESADEESVTGTVGDAGDGYTGEGAGGYGDNTGEDPHKGTNEYDVGMVVTLYGGEIPEMLVPLEGKLNKDGNLEYYVPVSIAEEIAEKYENAEVEVLDTDIEYMMALVIIVK